MANTKRKHKGNPMLYAWWKGKRGAQHNLSKPIMTPYGPFGSLREACDTLGIWYLTGWRWVHRGDQGYDIGWFRL